MDDLSNIDNPYFEGMVTQIYPNELQVNKANSADTEAAFVDLYLSIPNGFVHLQSTLVISNSKNISRYPYFDISDLQTWGKNKSNKRI